MKSIAPLLIIIVCGAAYYMYIGSEVTNVNDLRAKLAEYQTTQANSDELKTTLDSKLSTYNSIPASDIAKLDKIIPGEVNKVILVADLNTMASKYGMLVKDVKVVEEQPESADQVVTETSSKTYKVVTTTFSVTGQYEQFMRFLNDIETSVRLFDVRAISVKENQKTSGSASFDYTLQVDSYFLK